MFTWSVRLLRLVLVALFGLLVVLQTLSVPGGMRYDAQQHPEEAWLQWPLTISAGSVLLAAEVVVVGIWRILTLTAEQRLVSTEALRWLTRITACCAYAAAVLGVLLVWLGVIADDPGAPMILLFVTLCVSTLTLFAFVMRTALARALEASSR